MKLGNHYIRLREHYSNAGEVTEVNVTVDELAEVLDCTHRNVLLLLNRMSKINWIQWNPKRGRGNRSRLVFLIPTEQLILELAKNLVEKKDLRGALEQMNMPSIPPTVKENFNNWLYSYFGYRTEVKNHRKIDTLRFPLSGPLLTLDPVYTNFASESHLVRQIFDSLVRYNALTETIQPHLAHDWEVSKDRTRWTFYLRKGVLFHHGREMTADDVFYSLNRPKHLQERSLYRWIYTQMKQIKVIDPTTIEVELFQPNELFLPFLSTNRAAIVPEDACDESAERFGRNPLGTGPFKLIRNDPSMCVLEAFPHYNQGRAHLDRVEIWNIPDLYEQEHQNSLESFQIIHNAKSSDGNNPSLTQVKKAGTTCKFVTFNPLKAGPLKNNKLRHVLCHMLNSKKIVASSGSEDKIEAYGFLAETNTQKPLFNAETNHNLLQTANYRGEKLKLCTIPHYEKDAYVIQNLCNQAGIHIEVSLLTPEDFKGPKRLEADMILFALVLDNDTELRLIDLYKSMQLHLAPSIRNFLEGKIAGILSETSSTQRKIQFQEIERFLREEGWIHFLYQKQQKTVYHSSVKGIILDSLDWVQFKDVWFK